MKVGADPIMPTSQTDRPRRSPIRHLRWWICGLLFLITTINYLDRQSLAVLKPRIEGMLHWTEADFGWIMFFFQMAYAIFLAISGRVIDVLGVKLALGLAIALWSVAVAGHALARTSVQFSIARFFLGMAEAANFPASIKAVAQWFPQKERALATGIFNSGSNVGIMLAPFTVWLATRFGWQAAFVAIGIFGVIILVIWSILFNTPQKHPRISPQELYYIQSNQPPREKGINIHWTALLRCKQVWPFLLGKFMTDPVWWFYLYWLPSYLAKERGLSDMKGAWMLIIPYVSADIGSIMGGWISGHLIGRGWKVGGARYTAMFLCAICMPGAIYAAKTNNFWLAMGLISMATAGHQGWSANIFTTATDLFPARYAGSVVGLGGSTGALGGMFMTLLVGMTLQWFPEAGYKMVFTWAGMMHLSSLAIYRLIAGADLKQVDPSIVEMNCWHQGLILGGTLTMLAGLALTFLTWSNWADLVLKMNGISGPAGGITAAIGVVLIGLVLLYAGKPKKNPVIA